MVESMQREVVERKSRFVEIFSLYRDIFTLLSLTCFMKPFLFRSLSQLTLSLIVLSIDMTNV